MAISTSTSAAAIHSNTLPNQASAMRTGLTAERRALESSAVAVWLAFSMPATSILLWQLADRVLQDREGLLAIFAAPFLIEASLLQRLAEGRKLRLIENHALPGEIGLQRAVELGH